MLGIKGNGTNGGEEGRTEGGGRKKGNVELAHNSPEAL
jgi:hypothetical protein